MTHLLTETLDRMKQAGHEVEDVVFVGSVDGRYECSWEEFAKLADVEYDSGYGGANVAGDLVIRFRDGRKMWRGEYDGSEWWEADPLFEEDAAVRKPIFRIVRDEDHYWASLDEMNPDEEAQARSDARP